MGVLGVGMGLIASQLGLVVQSSVDASGRGEAGGLQYTGQQLGSSLGVALIGALVLVGLTGAFVTNVQQDERIAAGGRRPDRDGDGATGSTSSRPRTSRPPLVTAGLDEATTQAVVEDYEQAQLRRSRPAAPCAALIALASLAFTKDLPRSVPAGEEDAAADGDEPAPAAA